MSAAPSWPDLPLLLDRLAATGRTVAAAESLTGGLLCAALTDVPGASGVVRGGLVVYATDLKATLAGVDQGLLDRVGPVGPDVAVALAIGVRERLDAWFGLATTGVAGPDAQAGRPVGEVHVAVASPHRWRRTSHRFPGDRAAVRRASVAAVLDLLATEHRG